jgi:triacylglycerol lipase
MHSMPPDNPDRETVILLHGMGRSQLSMYVLGRRFEAADYNVHHFDYDDRKNTVAEISAQLKRHISETVVSKKYHLIGHSLGNIVIRHGFNEAYPAGLGRIVMLCPPNQKPYMAKLLQENFIYRLWTGVCGQELASHDFYQNLPIPKVDFGIIAGNKGQNLTFSEANDAVITVESTRLKGSKDWIVLPHAHTFIMNFEDTFKNARNFLKSGTFLN